MNPFAEWLLGLGVLLLAAAGLMALLHADELWTIAAALTGVLGVFGWLAVRALLQRPTD